MSDGSEQSKLTLTLTVVTLFSSNILGGILVGYLLDRWLGAGNGDSRSTERTPNPGYSRGTRLADEVSTVILSRRSAAKDLKLRSLRSFAVYAAQDDEWVGLRL